MDLSVSGPEKATLPYDELQGLKAAAEPLAEKGLPVMSSEPLHLLRQYYTHDYTATPGCSTPLSTGLSLFWRPKDHFPEGCSMGNTQISVSPLASKPSCEPCPR